MISTNLQRFYNELALDPYTQMDLSNVELDNLYIYVSKNKDNLDVTESDWLYLANRVQVRGFNGSKGSLPLESEYGRKGEVILIEGSNPNSQLILDSINGEFEFRMDYDYHSWQYEILNLASWLPFVGDVAAITNDCVNIYHPTLCSMNIGFALVPFVPVGKIAKKFKVQQYFTGNLIKKVDSVRYEQLKTKIGDDRLKDYISDVGRVGEIDSGMDLLLEDSNFVKKFDDFKKKFGGDSISGQALEQSFIKMNYNQMMFEKAVKENPKLAELARGVNFDVDIDYDTVPVKFEINGNTIERYEIMRNKLDDGFVIINKDSNKMIPLNSERGYSTIFDENGEILDLNYLKNILKETKMFERYEEYAKKNNYLLIYGHNIDGQFTDFFFFDKDGVLREFGNTGGIGVDTWEQLANKLDKIFKSEVKISDELIFNLDRKQEKIKIWSVPENIPGGGPIQESNLWANMNQGYKSIDNEIKVYKNNYYGGNSKEIKIVFKGEGDIKLD